MHHGAGIQPEVQDNMCIRGYAMYYNCVPRSLALAGKCIMELGSSLRYKVAFPSLLLNDAREIDEHMQCIKTVFPDRWHWQVSASWSWDPA